MRAVADTNVVISGLLWNGPSRSVLDQARSGAVQLFTSADLLAELEDVLSRKKFAKRLQRAHISAHELVQGYGALARIVRPAPLEPIVLADPDDDAVLACAFAAQANFVISGDEHLLALGQLRDVRIVTAVDFLAS
jgi:putative PIN family toxin of toxin-antitoxin system